MDIPDKLYDVAREIDILLDQLEHTDDEDEAVIEAAKERLSRWNETYDWMLDNLAKKVKNTDQEIAILEKRLEVRKNECKIIESRIKSKQRLLEWIKSYAKGTLVRLGIKRHETLSGIRLTVAKRPVSCEVLNRETVPEEYFRVKREPNLTALVQNFKETGELIEGVIFHTDKTSLRIK